MDLKKLRAPFPSKDVEWRVGRTGKSSKGTWAVLLPYITNRAIMNRLDDVVGPENWKNFFEAGPTSGVMCGISIRVENEWITKWDGAPETNIEAVKGGFSDSMKRAAVQWGIGRYLYYLDSQIAEVVSNRPQGRFVRVDDKKQSIQGYAVAPVLPIWALPEEDFKKKPSASKPSSAKKTSVSKPSLTKKPSASKPSSTEKPNTPEPSSAGKLFCPDIKGVTYRRKDNLIIAEGNPFAVKGLLKDAGFKCNPKGMWFKEDARRL